jgi:hypothetical protein
MQALHDVVQAGWVRYIGMSSCWAWQFQLMQRAWPPTLTWAILTWGRIRSAEQAHPVHLDAEPALGAVQGRRARDDADAQALWRRCDPVGTSWSGT